MQLPPQFELPFDAAYAPPAPREAKPADLQALATELLAELCRDHPMGYVPALEWRNLRVTAGLAYFKERRIVLSRRVLTDQERVRITLMHEYAHLLAVARHGHRAAGHGKAWRQAMLDLGQPPEVRHTYEVPRNQKRQLVTYRCTHCGARLQRHRKLARRRRWMHADCGGSLKLESVSALSPKD